MKRIVFIGVATLLIACGQTTPTTETTAQSQVEASGTEQYFGEKITADNAVSISELGELMGDKKEVAVKLEAPIEAVCQKKGCWMDLKTTEGESMRVTFKDYAFFVPKDASGKMAIVEGVAKVEETSVADLQEYAKDAGKTDDEVAAIKEPKKELVFEASGVLIK
jgi:hypothetical protein